MGRMPDCPICQKEFETTGLHPHIRSHDENELAAVVAQLAKDTSHESASTQSNEGGTWHQTMNHQKKIAALRTERDQKIKTHLEQLDARIQEALE